MPDMALPSTKPVEPPPEKEESVSLYHMIGFSSRNSTTKLWAGDSGTPFCYGDTTGDIYLTAASNCQILTKWEQHKVKNTNFQYFGSVDRKVSHTEIVLIGGDNNIQINGTQTVNVVSDHILNVAQKQSTTAHGGQSVTVKDGGRKLNVTGGRTVKVSGNYTQIVDDNDQEDILSGGFFLNGSVNLTNVIGDFMQLKLASEISMTFSEKIVVSLAEEIAASVGAYKKMNRAVNFEQFVGMKTEVSLANGISNTIGMTKIHDMSYSGTATKDELQASLREEKATLATMKALMEKHPGRKIHS